jgi:hypothetical protein
VLDQALQIKKNVYRGAHHRPQALSFLAVPLLLSEYLVGGIEENCEKFKIPVLQAKM